MMVLIVDSLRMKHIWIRVITRVRYDDYSRQCGLKDDFDYGRTWLVPSTRFMY